MQISNETITYELDLEADDKFINDVHAYIAELNGVLYQTGPNKHKVVLQCTTAEDMNAIVDQTRQIFHNIDIQS